MLANAVSDNAVSILTTFFVAYLIYKMLDLMGGIVTCRVNPGTTTWLGAQPKRGQSNLASSSDSHFVLSSIGTKKRKQTDEISTKTKTVYLIRHAESNENRRQTSLVRSLNRLGRMQMPLKDDVAASVELLDVRAQVDSFASEKGQKQINQLGRKLENADFVREKGIQLVAHSPLIRARQTSEGMLNAVTPRTASNVETLWEGKKPNTVDRVVELPCLAERTPLEWLPVNHDKFIQRIADFESWLNEQPEDKIAIVGHSQYFKSMLGLHFKFGNCDVWEIKYTPSLVPQFVHLGPNINVNGDNVQVIQELHAHGFEMIKSEPSFCDDVKSKECQKKMITNLPRGWSNLINLYTYEE